MIQPSAISFFKSGSKSYDQYDTNQFFLTPNNINTIISTINQHKDVFNSLNNEVVKSVNGVAAINNDVTLDFATTGWVDTNYGKVKTVNSLSPVNGNITLPNYIKTINNTYPDANGNCNVPTGGITPVGDFATTGWVDTNYGKVKTINTTLVPDSDGNITITGENINVSNLDSNNINDTLAYHIVTISTLSTKINEIYPHMTDISAHTESGLTKVKLVQENPGTLQATLSIISSYNKSSQSYMTTLNGKNVIQLSRPAASLGSIYFIKMFLVIHIIMDLLIYQVHQ